MASWAITGRFHDRNAAELNHAIVFVEVQHGRSGHGTTHSSWLILNLCYSNSFYSTNVNFFSLTSSATRNDTALVRLRCRSCHCVAILMGRKSLTLHDKGYLAAEERNTESNVWLRKHIQIYSCFSSHTEDVQMSDAQTPRAHTCHRVWPRHHEGRWCLGWVGKRSFRRVGWRMQRHQCPSWGAGLRLLVWPRWGVGLCGCGTTRVFFGHRGAGVGPHALCQAMARAASQTAIFTPLQAGSTAIVILWRTGDGGWEEMKMVKWFSSWWEMRKCVKCTLQIFSQGNSKALL